MYLCNCVIFTETCTCFYFKGILKIITFRQSQNYSTAHGKGGQKNMKNLGNAFQIISVL